MLKYTITINCITRQITL